MATPMIAENWPKLLEPGLRFLFQQQLDRREALGKRKLIFHQLDSERRDEEGFSIGALSDEDWNFEVTKQINYGSVRPGFVANWTHRQFGKGMTIERTLIDDNLYNASKLPRSVTVQPGQLADAAFVLREKAAAEIFNYATTASGLSPSGFPLAGPDGKALGANDHPNYPGAGVSEVQDNLFAYDLTDANYSLVRQAMRAYTDDNGNIVQVNPTTLIVPPEMEDQAEVIKQSRNKPGTADNDANVIGGRIERIIVWDYLTDSNRWFVVDPMLMNDHLVWFERIPLEFKATEDFDTLQGKYRAYMRYSRGFSDWRWCAVSEAS